MKTPHKRTHSTAFPTPQTMGKSKKTKTAKKSKKAPKKAIKNTSVTFQNDRATEYRSQPVTPATKRAKKFEKRVLTALQKKLAPNYIMLNNVSNNLSVLSGKQNIITTMLWSSQGASGSSDDIFKIYNQVGGPTSAVQGYTYDLNLHHAILEVDLCLETSSAQVAQGFLDVYTIRCRKDVISSSSVNAGMLRSH